MTWILPTHIPRLPLTGVTTHRIWIHETVGRPKGAKDIQKRKAKQPKRVRIGRREFKSVSAASMATGRHHSTIKSWIKQGKARYL